MHAYQEHMHAERKRLQSTKSKNKEKEEEMDSFSTSDKLSVRVNHVCYTIVDPNKTIIWYIDLIGRFSKRSSRGNQYIIVGYYCNANHIRAIPIKTRQGQTIIEA